MLFSFVVFAGVSKIRACQRYQPHGEVGLLASEKGLGLTRRSATRVSSKSHNISLNIFTEVTKYTASSGALSEMRLDFDIAILAGQGARAATK
jgi:hypothetical protein